MWAKKQKSHVGLSASKNSIFRVKFSLLIAKFSGDLCKQDCFLNGIAFIQIAPLFLMLSEFTLCPNPPMSTIWLFQAPIFGWDVAWSPMTRATCGVPSSKLTFPKKCVSPPLKDMLL